MEILEELWNKKIYYKGVKVNMFGVPFLGDKKYYSQNSFGSTISRLKAKGLIEINNNRWSLTEKGRKYFEDKRRLKMRFASPFVINAPKNLLLMFDIPESKRAERNWLRWHLREFQYYMIQKSVWVGPSPLPKKFVVHLKETGLHNNIKTFRLAKPYQISKTNSK